MRAGAGARLGIPDHAACDEFTQAHLPRQTVAEAYIPLFLRISLCLNAPLSMHVLQRHAAAVLLIEVVLLAVRCLSAESDITALDHADEHGVRLAKLY